MAESTTATIMIAAPRTAVMAVIADFAAYPTWAGVDSARVVGEPGPDGRARTVAFELDAKLARERFALAYEWDGDIGVRWKTAKPGKMLTTMSGSYRLTDRDSGTEVTFELVVGIRIPLIGPLRRQVERAVIDAALNGLQARVTTLR
jgi:Polyketide cyclase / dehydrase and lipid transport